jgi:hypothetical protein
MAEVQRHRTGTCVDSPRPSRRLLRLLRTHAARIDAVRTAEFNYHGVVMTEFLRRDGMGTSASVRRIDGAFENLAKAVAALHESQVAVRSVAALEGIPSRIECAIDEAFESASREYAAYLAAHSRDQVFEVATRGPFLRNGR